MGIYLNPTNIKFAGYIKSEYYVDKTDIISFTNRVMGTLGNYICVSRPRRFGKTMMADMLTAYYSKGCASCDLFKSFKIAEDISFDTHLNKYNTIFLNMQQFLSEYHQ